MNIDPRSGHDGDHIHMGTMVTQQITLASKKKKEASHTSAKLFANS